MKDEIKNAILAKERWIINYLSEDLLDSNVPKNNDLKIAIQISGGLRTFNFITNWINKFVIEPLNADVFIHGWANTLGVEENTKQISNYLNVKSFKINDINSDEYKYLRKKNLTHDKVYGNYFNVYECNKLRNIYESENNIKYDLVIKCKFDALFFSDFDKIDLEYILNNNCVGIPEEYFKLWCPWTTDVLAITKPEIMNKYCDCYLFLDDALVKYSNTEGALCYNLNKNMSDVSIYNILPNFVIDYPLFISFDELEKVNTRLYY